MRTHYNPKNSPRVIIIQKLYGKFFNEDNELDFPKHRFKKFIKDIVLGTIERNELILDELNFIMPDIDISAPTLKLKCSAKIRSLSKPSEGTLYKKENTFSFIFDNPTESITRGQACVLYDNERVLGGGIIKQKLN